MQGWAHHIPTEQKVAYINSLLKVGFDTIDFGSFVSAKAIPQLADTKEVIPQLQLNGSKSKLLAIIANTRGAEEAVQYDEITYLGFPFSISETFQLRNTNSTIEQSLATVQQIQELCVKHGKQLVIYISMGFGNPYGDPYNAEVAIKWVEQLTSMGIGIVSMADTVGVANAETSSYIFSHLSKAFPNTEIGAHFHSAPHNWLEKVDSAYNNGCLRFDSALKGIGGCPMAKDELVGNLATENLIYYFEDKQIDLGLNKEALLEAQMLADRIFI